LHDEEAADGDGQPQGGEPRDPEAGEGGGLEKHRVDDIGKILGRDEDGSADPPSERPLGRGKRQGGEEEAGEKDHPSERQPGKIAPVDSSQILADPFQDRVETGGEADEQSADDPQARQPALPPRPE